MSRDAYRKAITTKVEAVTLDDGRTVNASTLKSVLLAVAWYANPETGEAHPGRQLLADHTATSTKSVSRALIGLEMLGLIEVVSRGNRYGATVLKVVDDSNVRRDPGSHIEDVLKGTGGPIELKGTGGPLLGMLEGTRGPLLGTRGPLLGTGGPPNSINRINSTTNRGREREPTADDATPARMPHAQRPRPAREAGQFLDGNGVDVSDRVAEVVTSWQSIQDSGLDIPAAERAQLLNRIRKHPIDDVLGAIAEIEKGKKRAADGGRRWKRIGVEWIDGRIADLKTKRNAKPRRGDIEASWKRGPGKSKAEEKEGGEWWKAKSAP